jgi:hypothetical protein
MFERNEQRLGELSVRATQTHVYTIRSLLLVFILTTGWNPVWSQTTVSARDKLDASFGYKEFLDRVQSYVRLHKTIESTLPTLKRTDRPELISAHQQALARKIREVRTNAKRGDIFTESSEKAFRDSIRDEFQGAHAQDARTTIQQGAPVKALHLHVNEAYPDGVPFTTVPPTLLLKFPKLPDQVAYRIVGHDLVLLDVEANLVIDTIPETIPSDS